MLANVESMMYVREVPWHGLGTKVSEAPNSMHALELAGLNWEVRSKEMHLEDGTVIPGYKANVRETDGSVLGVVSDRYKIVQNDEAFAFTDALIGENVRYETAGSLRGGKQIWLLARLPEREICGDKTEPYMCFTNSHDGNGAIQVCMTPVRVVCNNTLNFALSTARRNWSVRHVGNIENKLEEAKFCLQMADAYMEDLSEYAEEMVKKPVTDAEIKKILDELFPTKEDDSERKKQNVQELKTEYMVCYFAPDIAKFRGTAWGAINAMADMVDHNNPRRATSTYRENNWGRIMTGHAMVDAMVKKLI